jgi:hypothetical protein
LPISLVVLRVGAARFEIHFNACHCRCISCFGQQRPEPDGAINSYGNAARAARNAECSTEHTGCGPIAAALSK